MRLDLRVVPKNHKNLPFTMAAIDGGLLFARLKQLRDRGMNDLGKVIDQLEEEVGGKDFTKPMDMGDLLSFVIESSKEYQGEAVVPKRVRAKLLRKLTTEGEIEFSADEIAVFKADTAGPRISGAMMIAIEDEIKAAEDRHDAEEARKKAEAEKAAKLVAVEGKGGAA